MYLYIYFCQNSNVLYLPCTISVICSFRQEEYYIFLTNAIRMYATEPLHFKLLDPLFLCVQLKQQYTIHLYHIFISNNVNVAHT